MLISCWWNYRFKCCKCSVHSNTSIHHFTSSLTRWTLRQTWGSDVMDGVDCMSASDLHVWLQVYHIPECDEWDIEVTQNWNGNAVPKSLQQLLYTLQKTDCSRFSCWFLLCILTTSKSFSFVAIWPSCSVWRNSVAFLILANHEWGFHRLFSPSTRWKVQSNLEELIEGPLGTRKMTK